jgi:serine O-acetyltransferase
LKHKNLLSLWLNTKKAHFFSGPSRISGLMVRFICALNNSGYVNLAKLYARSLTKDFGIHINPNAKIGNDVVFPHPIGIVIGKGVIIGKGVTIYQNVTIGADASARQSSVEKTYPNIGDDTVIFGGAYIVGDISIGKNSIIGANSVVISDIPDNSVVAGIPGKVIRSKNE